MGRDPASRHAGALHRDGRPAPDLAVRPRHRRSSASGPASGIENIVDGPLDRRRVRPAERPGDRRQRTCSSPTREVSGVRSITARQAQAPPRRSTIVGERPLRLRRRRRHGRRGPAPALPRRGLRRRQALHRRHLQQQDQGLRPRRPRPVETLVGTRQAGRQRQPAPVLPARRPERGRLEPLRRRHQQPQDPGRRPRLRQGGDPRDRRAEPPDRPPARADLPERDGLRCPQGRSGPRRFLRGRGQPPHPQGLQAERGREDPRTHRDAGQGRGTPTSTVLQSPPCGMVRRRKRPSTGTVSSVEWANMPL